MEISRMIGGHTDQPLPNQLLMPWLKCYKRPNDKILELKAQGILEPVHIYASSVALLFLWFKDASPSVKSVCYSGITRKSTMRQNSNDTGTEIKKHPEYL